MANGNASMHGDPQHEQFLTGVDYRGLEVHLDQLPPPGVSMGEPFGGLVASGGSVINDVAGYDDTSEGMQTVHIDSMAGLDASSVLASFNSMFGYDFVGDKEDLQGGMDSLEGVPILGLPAVIADERLYRQPDMTNTGISGDGTGLIPAENEMDDR